MYKTKIHFDFTCQKSGRGSAVLRGLLLARNKFPKAMNFVECDADESHRVEDVLRVLKVGQKNDFVIGSRYLRDSQILGWPFSRRVFSRGLNIVIPKLLQLEIRDITNGLRSYSVKATDILLSHQFMNSGFIMLSEIALLLGDRRIVPYELPSIFVNRRLGNSTVTKVEIVDSLTGLLNLFIKYRLSWRLK
jgi:dolichol-phosphate mannosyltransferase